MQNTLNPTPIGKQSISEIIDRDYTPPKLTTPYFKPEVVEMDRPRPLANRLAKLVPRNEVKRSFISIIRNKLKIK